MKKLMSLFMAFSIAYTLVPTSVLAEGEGQENAPLACDANAVACIGEVGFATLQEAINVNDTAEINLKKEVTESITIGTGKNITLNLNGNNITNTADQHTITNNGTLVINGKGTDGEGTVDNVSNQKAALYNRGEVTLNGGNYTRSLEAGTIDPDQSNGNSYYTVANRGTMTINSGASISNKGGFSSTICNSVNENGYINSTLTVNGGNISGGKNAIKNDERGTLTIVDGSISSDNVAVMNWNSAQIDGGSIISNNSSPLSNSSDIDGGTYCGGGAEACAGTLTINNGKFNGAKSIFSVADDLNAYTNLTNGKITVNGGEFTGESLNTIVDNQFNSITINGGSLSVTQPVSSNEYTTTASNLMNKVNTNGTTIAAGTSVNNLIQSLQSGDTLQVIKTDMNNIVVTDNVSVENKTDSSITVNDEVVGVSADSYEKLVQLINEGKTVIEISSDIHVKEPINTNSDIVINGNGNTLYSEIAIGDGKGNKSIITSNNGKLTLNDLTLANSPKYGAQAYNQGTLELNNVTIDNPGFGGVLINGSTATLNNVKVVNTDKPAVELAMGTGITSMPKLGDNSTVTGGSGIYVDGEQIYNALGGDNNKDEANNKLDALVETTKEVAKNNNISLTVKNADGSTDEVVKPVQPSQSEVSKKEDKKPVATWDDGGPFTTDACGNVFDRWGNEVYHAPVCVNNNSAGSNTYTLVNTSDR